METRDVAISYINAGLSIIPLRCDGSKGPTGETWKAFQSKLPTEAQVSKWWGNGREFGIGIIGGAISGNLERIDFDDKDIYGDWVEIIDQEGLLDFVGTLPLVATPNGYHLYYRCDEPVPGNLKLARRPTETGWDTLIETRGEGGYTVAPGSPLAVHASGKPYEVLIGDLCAIPTVTKDERDRLIGCARVLNEYIEPEKRTYTVPTERVEGRPGDDYNARGDWRGLLTGLGWKHVYSRGDTDHWRRPGKAEGVSATWNHRDSQLFYVFSSNAAPFETERSYDPFGIYATVEHSGDFQAAGKALARDGYGSPERKKTAAPEPERTDDDAPVEVIPEPPMTGKKRVKSPIEDAVFGCISHGHGTPEHILLALEESFPDITIAQVLSALTVMEMGHEIYKTAAGYKLPGGPDEPHRDPETGAPMDMPKFPCTPMGNAERLVWRLGGNLRYVTDWKKWIIWDGTRWQIDSDLTIERLAKETVRSIYNEARDCDDEARRKRLATWAIKSETAKELDSMVKIARSDVAITSGTLDRNPYLLCCTNGVLDLVTGELLAPLRGNLITKQVPIDYEPEAESPMWMAFLEQMLPDPDIREYIQKAAGYTLVGEVTEKCLFFLYGGGNNGKTVLTKTLEAIMGDYFRKTKAQTLMLKFNGGGIPNDVAALYGARMVSVSEISEGQRLDEGLVKDITGGDTMSARFMRSEFFDFDVGFTLWLYGNHKPAVKGKDDGIWNRIRLIPFLVQIPDEKCDKHLPEKLRGELSGILRWAVEGCLKWQKEGRLAVPQSLQAAVNEYRNEEDALGDFWQSGCTVWGAGATVLKRDLYEAHKRFAEESGEEGYKNQRDFNKEVGRHPRIKSDHGHANVAIWRGIGLKNEVSENLFDDSENRVNEVNENCGIDGEIY
jgi:P4 family phage/plasmid primase-like protien